MITSLPGANETSPFFPTPLRLTRAKTLPNVCEKNGGVFYDGSLAIYHIGDASKPFATCLPVIAGRPRADTSPLQVVAHPLTSPVLDRVSVSFPRHVYAAPVISPKQTDTRVTPTGSPVAHGYATFVQRPLQLPPEAFVSPSPLRAEQWHVVGQRLASVFQDCSPSPSSLKLSPICSGTQCRNSVVFSPTAPDVGKWQELGQRMSSALKDVSPFSHPSSTPIGYVQSPISLTSTVPSKHFDLQR